MKLHTNATRTRRGAALVEYGLLVAGVAIVALAAISILGNRVTGLFATSAAVLPGTQAADNGPIIAGQLVKTQDGVLALDVDGQTIGDNLGLDQATLEALVKPPVAPQNP